MRGLLLWLVGVGLGGGAGVASGETPQQCIDLKLSVSSARPTHYVAFQGISDAFREAGLTADIRVPGVDDLFATDLVDLGGDRGEFLVLLHPINGLEGGAVEIVFTAGDLQCPGLPFTIEELEPAPGVLAELAETYASIVETQLELLGGPTDDSPVPDDAPAIVHDLDGLRKEIRGGEGGASLQDATAALDPQAAGTAGALMEEAGVVEQVRGLADGLSEMSEGPAGPTGPGESPDVGPEVGPEVSPDFSPGWLTPARLESLMQLQQALESQVTGRNKRIYDSASAGFGAAAGAAAATGVGAPLAAALGTAATIISGSVVTGEFVAGNLPAVLEQMVLEGDPVSFEEDHPRPEGRWSADLYASTKGFKLDMTTALGLVPAFKGIGNAASAGFRAVPNLQPVASAMAETLASFANALIGAERSAQNASGVVEMAPMLWGPVPVDAERDQELMQWQLTTRAFELDGIDPHLYRGREAGPSILVVRTRPGRFVEQSASSSLDLEVRPIIVTLFGPNGRSDITHTAPDRPITLQATVQNALNPCLRWSARNGGDLVPPDNCETPSAQFSAAEHGDYGVEAESMTRTGIRASASPKRYGGITVRVGGLRLRPAPSCVEVGETVAFEVFKWNEPVPYSVMFEASGGTIGPDGAFTATTQGTGSVRATDPEEPDLTDEITFDIKVECIGWTMELSGPVTGIWQGYCANYASSDVLSMGLFNLNSDGERPEQSPFLYQLFDEEGNQVTLMMDPRGGTTTKADGSVSRATSLSTTLVLWDRPGPSGQPPLTLFHDPGDSPGLTIEHTAKPDLKGSAWLLAGSMSGALYQPVIRNDQIVIDDTPILVQISFKGMGNNGYQPVGGPGGYMSDMARMLQPGSPVDLSEVMNLPDRLRCQPEAR